MDKDIKDIIVLTETDSTNNYANHLLSAKSVKDGTVVLAQFQNKGRGQRDNHWESPKGENLLVSIIVYPHFLPAPMQFYLSKAASIALVEWLRNHNIQAKIKWPNDIYIEKNKIAGILIETSVKGNSLDSAVIGIGLNLNQTAFDSNLPNPISLKKVTGQQYNIVDTANEVRKIFMHHYKKLESGAIHEIDSAYFTHLFQKDEWALYRDKDGSREGRIISIGEYGHLILEDRTGKKSTYAFKEIEFVL